MKAKLVKENLDDKTVGDIISVLIDAQNAVQDVLESSLPFDISKEDIEQLSNSMNVLRKLEMQYGNENHGMKAIL